MWRWPPLLPTGLPLQHRWAVLLPSIRCSKGGGGGQADRQHVEPGVPRNPATWVTLIPALVPLFMWHLY